MLDQALSGLLAAAALAWGVYSLTRPVACWRAGSWIQRLPFVAWFAGLVYVAFFAADSGLRRAALVAPLLLGACEIVRRWRVGRDLRQR